MRFVRDALEIDSLQQGIAFQTTIFEKIMSSLKPGTSETLGQAFFDYEIQIAPANISHGIVRATYATTLIVGEKRNAATHFTFRQRELYAIVFASNILRSPP